MSTPRIYIDGHLLATSSSAALRDQLVGVAAVTIPWGTAAHTDTPQSHVATVKLVERGNLARFPRHGAYIGTTVRVASPLAAASTQDERTVFIGQVTDAATRSVQLSDGPAVEVTLTCTDTIGVLSQIRPRGNYEGFTVGGSRRYPGAWKLEGYRQTDPIRRLIDVTEAGDLEQWVGPISISSYNDQLHDGVQADDIPDAWTLIRQAYALAQPLGIPRFNEWGMTSGGPATAGHVEIVRRGSMLDIHAATPSTTIPASAVRITDPQQLPDLGISHRYRRATAHLAKRIVNMEIAGGQQRSDVEDASTEVRAGVQNHSGSQREYVADLGAGASISKLDGSEQPGAWPYESTTRANASEASVRSHVQAIAARLTSLNQWARIPPVLIVEGDLPASLNYTMFATLPSFALWIAGSKWAAMPQMPRIVQMIGGELTWTGKRWEHLVNLAATLDEHGKNLTIDEALGHLDDTVDNWTSTATVAMLADVTRTTAT